MTSRDTAQHWLVRRPTLCWLRRGGIALVLVTLLMNFAVPSAGAFGLGAWPGFAGILGFGACTVLVLAANALGRLIKRTEDYYSTNTEAGAGNRDA